MQKGQSLVTLLIFVLIAITITTGAIFLTITNSINSTKLSIGQEAYYVAESGAENALLRLLRDPSYTGEVLSLGDNVATITVSGTNPITILSVGRARDFVKKIQVTALYTDNVLKVTSWREVY